MPRVTIEFASKPKREFEDAQLSISDNKFFIVTDKEENVHLFPFENVISACEFKDKHKVAEEK